MVQYQPGHTTYAFLRVQNISADEITLKVGMHIAQIYFEELKERPEKTYAEQKNASFRMRMSIDILENMKRNIEKY